MFGKWKSIGVHYNDQKDLFDSSQNPQHSDGIVKCSEHLDFYFKAENLINLVKEFLETPN
jgi:hypothetical protein